MPVTLPPAAISVRGSDSSPSSRILRYSFGDAPLSKRRDDTHTGDCASATFFELVECTSNLNVGWSGALAHRSHQNHSARTENSDSLTVHSPTRSTSPRQTPPYV